MHNPTQAEINNQIEWEGDNITAGIERYRIGLTKLKHRRDGTTERVEADLGDTDTGVKICTDMVKPIAAGIRSAQESALDDIAAAIKGKGYRWHWVIQTLSAEVLAAITVRCLLAFPARSGRTFSGRTATEVALAIGTALRDECEYRAWREESKRAAKEDEDKRDVAALLVGKCRGNVSRRTFARWRRKIADIERLQWTRRDMLQTGSVLLENAIRHGGGWFLMDNVYSKGRTYRVVMLSPEAQAAIANIDSKLEASRPYLLPLTCPPRPWRKLPCRTDSSTASD